MRFVVLTSLAVLGVVSTASAGDRYGRYYSTAYCTPYYAPSYNYSYYPSYQQQTYAAPAYSAPPVYSSSWREEVIKYAAGLKEIEAFNKAMEAIQPGYASHASYVSGQGATVYATPAYSFKAATTTENVGVNLELADQRTARLLSGVNDSFAQGSAQRTEFLATASAENARVAEINAKRDSAAVVLQQAAALLKSADAAGVSKTTTVVSGTGNAPTTVIQPNVAVDRSAFIKSVARADCQECHTPGAKMKGNFSVEALGSINRAQANEILRRITSIDRTVVMPKPADGQPVKHVSDEHMAAWVAMLSSVQ